MFWEYPEKFNEIVSEFVAGLSSHLNARVSFSDNESTKMGPGEMDLLSGMSANVLHHSELSLVGSEAYRSQAQAATFSKFRLGVGAHGGTILTSSDDVVPPQNLIRTNSLVVLDVWR